MCGIKYSIRDCRVNDYFTRHNYFKQHVFMVAHFKLHQNIYTVLHIAQKVKKNFCHHQISHSVFDK
jgi:hypothetical protein